MKKSFMAWKTAGNNFNMLVGDTILYLLFFFISGMYLQVAVFSKTYCPYCTKAKRALQSVGASAFVVELDERNDGDAIQAELG